MKHTLAHDNKGNIQETAYHYDLNGNLVRAANRHSITCFDYNPNGQLIGQHQWKVPTREENARNGLPETDWRDPQYEKSSATSNATNCTAKSKGHRVP